MRMLQLLWLGQRDRIAYFTVEKQLQYEDFTDIYNENNSRVQLLIDCVGLQTWQAAYFWLENRVR